MSLRNDKVVEAIFSLGCHQPTEKKGRKKYNLNVGISIIKVKLLATIIYK
jgi:hypothetical protein